LLGLLPWWVTVALRLGLLWWAVAHAVGLWAARADRRFFDVLRRHLALPGHLDA
jgi:type IV secretion system protein VirB3